MRVGVVIPAKDEERWIARTLSSLLDQSAGSSAEVEVVVVENASTDRTADVVGEFVANHPGDVTLLRNTQPSAIAARIVGMQYLLTKIDPAQYLVSGDADTMYPPGWIKALARELESGADVVSCAGYMDPQLWERCPRVAQRYVEQVGSIFFDPDTILKLGVDQADCLFTGRVYADFGRPLVSPGFAITADAYQCLGGFRREYYDAGGQREILIAAAPLMFRAELAGLQFGDVTHPWWLASPRRLVSEPDVQLGREFQHTDMDSLRAVEDAAYEAFDASADEIDYHGLRLNCIRDYVLTPSVIRPTRIETNPGYFGSLGGELVKAVLQLHEMDQIDPRHVFDAAADLTDRYGDRIIEELRMHRRLK